MAAQNLLSSSKLHWNHDVFLSFRGEDTRKNFTDHLYSALVHVGVRTFRDDEELRRGEKISTGLLNAIRGSKMSIVVFSKGYASSRWCLDELVEILHCKNTKTHALFPIFYHVNPAEVRKQSGTFAEAFASHEERFQADMERVKRWRAAVTEAASYSGWDLESVANGYEAKFIKEIVQEILGKLKRAHLNVAKHPIGINPRVENIKTLLDIERDDHDVLNVGIYGMGGIGKTTLAKAVYNEVCDGFEGSSFLLNIKETSQQPNGLVQLQRQLLLDTLKKENLMISSVDRGINLIKESLQCKRILVVLDDVDQLKQVYALVGNFDWFGRGSRIIMTTRDEHLLTQLGVNEKYKVEELSYFDSLQLFSWHAFKMPNPIENYHEFSVAVLRYTGGLPLALEVLGSYLLQRSIIEWKSALEKLEKTPHQDIHKTLKISFDSLDDTTTKIFLDIACFFLGMEREYVNKILYGCGLFPDMGINILIQRSLVTTDYHNKLRMHDLVRDMGREIVRERSPYDLNRRSRLWFHEDVLKVLMEHTGSDAVEGLALNLPVLKDVSLKTKAFANMKNLRLLQMNNVRVTGRSKHLPKELRWLCWHKCPLRVLPLNFHLENLVVLDMQHSKIKEVWQENRILEKLKVLDLSYCKDLIRSPYFLQVPHLEILVLEECTNLVKLHKSIGHLKELVLLNLKGCTNLRYLPSNISTLKSLEKLNLSGCLNLDKLLEKIPKNFLRARPLGRLVLNNCDLSEDQMPIDLGNLSSLQGLDLSGNNFRNLPACINRLQQLQHLDIGGCGSLQSISGLPSKIESLFAYGCCSIESLSFSSSSQLAVLCLDSCSKLVEIQGLVLDSNSTISLIGCDNLSSDFRESLLQCPPTMSAPCNREAFLPGNEIPNWFIHQRIGSSISLNLPSVSEGEIRMLLVCGIYACGGLNPSGPIFNVIMDNKTRGYREALLPGGLVFLPINYSEDIFLFRWQVSRNKMVVRGLTPKILEIGNGDEIAVSFELGVWTEVKKCGVHVVVDEPKVLDIHGSPHANSNTIAYDKVFKVDATGDEDS